MHARQAERLRSRAIMLVPHRGWSIAISLVGASDVPCRAHGRTTDTTQPPNSSHAPKLQTLALTPSSNRRTPWHGIAWGRRVNHQLQLSAPLAACIYTFAHPPLALGSRGERGAGDWVAVRELNRTANRPSADSNPFLPYTPRTLSGHPRCVAYMLYRGFREIGHYSRNNNEEIQNRISHSNRCFLYSY